MYGQYSTYLSSYKDVIQSTNCKQYEANKQYEAKTVEEWHIDGSAGHYYIGVLLPMNVAAMHINLLNHLHAFIYHQNHVLNT